jgi:hypothetical protein
VPARRRPTAAPVPAGHLVRADAWAGLRPGDAVEVAGTRLRSATWAYVAHVTNTQTGDEWVEVVGGRPGERKLRSFRPEQVFPPGAGGARGSGAPSLADAPRLPLA